MDSKETKFKQTKTYKEFYEPRIKQLKKILNKTNLELFESKSFFQQLTAVDLLENKKVFYKVKKE